MNPISEAIISTVIKIVIWIIPVFLLVRMVERRKPFYYLGLRSNFDKGLKWSVWISLALGIYFILINLIVLESKLNFNIEFSDLLDTVILAGITEEIVFRGFLLKKFMDSFKFWKANIITSLLFVLIHFPIWFYQGLFEFPYIISLVIQIFILSMIFGFIYRKTNALWSVIIIHSMYNLLIQLFN